MKQAVPVRHAMTAIIAAALCCMAFMGPAAGQERGQAGEEAAAVSPEEIIDPHFTGKHCDTCHLSVPEPGDADPRLAFGADDVAMCNSCHDSEYVTADLHPVNIVPRREENTVRVPEDLPLYGGRITCRTCHDVVLQCLGKPSDQYRNINFLRGAPYQKTTDLCFRCHQRDAYKKTNPHEQLDPEGRIIEDRCLYCHQSLPDQGIDAAVPSVTFKTETSTFCASCHGEEEALHPAGVNHIQQPDEDMLSAIAAAERTHDVILPLFRGAIFCGTCHNPHDEGVITRSAAARGAAEELKLRLDGKKEICVACHSEKEEIPPEKIDPADIRQLDALIPLSRGEGIPSYHQSFIEKKCRACHSITPDDPGPPMVYKMCFQADCHDTSLIQKPFKHGEALQAHCLLCHSQHGSQFGAHIVNDQQKLCKACHPFLGAPDDSEKTDAGDDYHGLYYGLFEELVSDQEMTCSYCHGEDHSGRVSGTGIIPCYRCHNYIERLVRNKPGRQPDIHHSLDGFAGRTCTSCHDPHSSIYPDLLKDQPETYQ